MILVQHTTGRSAEIAVANLDGFLTPQKLLALPDKKMEELIYPAGFYHQKTQYIKNLMRWYVDQGTDLSTFDAMPTTTLRQELRAIRGVGEETADDMLLYIFERPVFVADVYARRLFARLGFKKYPSYQAMRQDFKAVTQGQTAHTCREWHAVIDEHGKRYRRHPDMDESWLQN